VHLRSLRDAFATVMPIFILAGLAVLVNNVVFPWIFEGERLAQYKVWGEAIINGTLNIAALLLAPMIAWSLARNKNFDNPVSAVVIAVSSFIIMMPMRLQVVPVGSETAVNVTQILTFANIGSTGIFAGVLIGLVSAEVFIAIEQQQIAEVEDFQGAVQAVKGRQIQQPVGAGRVEKGALPAGIGHHLRHGGRRKGGALNPLTINVILVKHRHDVVAVVVLADQPHRLQGKPYVQLSQREQDIERRAAGGAFAVGDLRQPAALRPLDDLVDMVHQHIARGDNPFALHQACPALPKMRICSATVSVIASSIPSRISANSS
jgi:hypothetical protein